MKIINFLYIIITLACVACQNDRVFYEPTINIKLEDSSMSSAQKANRGEAYTIEVLVQLYGGENRKICLEKSKIPIIGAMLCQKDSIRIEKYLCAALQYHFFVFYENNRIKIAQTSAGKKNAAFITYQVKGIKQLSGSAQMLPLGVESVLFARFAIEVEANDKTKYSKEEVEIINNNLFVKWSQRSGVLNFSLYLDFEEWLPKLQEQQPFELINLSKNLNINILEGYEPRFFLLKKKIS